MEEKLNAAIEQICAATKTLTEEVMKSNTNIEGRANALSRLSESVSRCTGSYECLMRARQLEAN